MAAPAWFEYQTYFDNKLAELKANDAQGNWTPEKLTSAFQESGFTVDADGLYSHFVQYGNTVAENVSPNSYFVVSEYMANKLAEMRVSNPGYPMSQLEAAFEAANLSAWDHYTQYGIREGINPSAAFNTNKYMDAKLAEMQKTDPNYTMDQLYEAFKTENMQPEHRQNLSWFDDTCYSGQENPAGVQNFIDPASLFRS